MKGGIFGNLEGSTKLKIFHASHDHEDVKSFTCKKAKRSVKLRQRRIIKGVKTAVGTSMLEKIIKELHFMSVQDSSKNFSSISNPGDKPNANDDKYSKYRKGYERTVQNC